MTQTERDEIIALQAEVECWIEKTRADEDRLDHKYWRGMLQGINEVLFILK